MCSDGTIVKFTNMFDDEGDETDDPYAAAKAVAQLPSGKWACIFLDEFESIGIH